MYLDYSSICVVLNPEKHGMHFLSCIVSHVKSKGLQFLSLRTPEVHLNSTLSYQAAKYEEARWTYTKETGPSSCITGQSHITEPEKPC